MLNREFKSREDLAVYLKAEFPGATGDLSSVPGGLEAARKVLASFPAGRYAATRNFLDGAVSGLSPYLRHGVLTLAEVRRALAERHHGLDSLLKFVQELAWRDYWQRIYAEQGERIWKDFEEYKTGLHPGEYSSALPADVATGETGLACMDGFVTQLREQGTMHNHARMWFAAYLVHWRRVQWQAGAKFFLEHLLDGDPASNNLSWQWVASTFSSKPYIFNRENLERYSGGKYCAGCPARTRCPFERSYEELSEKLFKIV